LLIQDSTKIAPAFALFNLGFRPFFLLGSVFSLISIFIWGGVYVYRWAIPALPFSPLYWHAHEMIFGYGMAVIAGFLLTAVRNWTNLRTLEGTSLAGLVLLWLGARLAGWVIPGHAGPMLFFDLAFNLGLIAAITRPILQARQKQQLGIVSKLVMLMLANLLFYLGVMDVLPQGIRWGLFSGIYLLTALIFNMARRVVPFFIERGVGYPVEVRNWLWVDRSSLIALLLLWISDVFWQNEMATTILAGLLFAIHSIRLIGWHTKGIWSRPLLWVLFVGYSGVTFGFLLKALTPILSLSPFLWLHAFALGGIGIMTIGMMARVSLGHTGRDIQNPPALLVPVFLLLCVAFVARIVLPMLDVAHYAWWIGMAQATWIVAYGLFVFVYAPAWVRPRVDGLPG
jgi:uncharacterized protein involved in response to NO